MGCQHEYSSRRCVAAWPPVTVELRWPRGQLGFHPIYNRLRDSTVAQDTPGTVDLPGFGATSRRPVPTASSVPGSSPGRSAEPFGRGALADQGASGRTLSVIGPVGAGDHAQYRPSDRAVREMWGTNDSSFFMDIRAAGAWQAMAAMARPSRSMTATAIPTTPSTYSSLLVA